MGILLEWNTKNQTILTYNFAYLVLSIAYII